MTGRPPIHAVAMTNAERQKRWRGSALRKRNERALFRSRIGSWETPPELFERYDAEHHFTLDAAASPENAKVATFYTEADDSLSQPWTGRVWLNPPYGRGIGDWMRKAWQSSLDGAVVVALVPARTDTRWWNDYATKGSIDFIKGRLRFGGAKNTAPFPSAVITWAR